MKEILLLTIGFALLGGIMLVNLSGHTEYLLAMSYTAAMIFEEWLKSHNHNGIKRKSRKKSKRKRNHNL